MRPRTYISSLSILLIKSVKTSFVDEECTNFPGKYNARQLSRITLSVPPFCLSVGENLCHFQYRAPDYSKKASCDTLTNLYGR